MEYTAVGSISCDIFPEAFEEDSLRRVRLSDIETGIAFGFVKRKEDALSPAAAAFVKYLGRALTGEG